MARGKRYTQEEVDYILDHYMEDGPESVARHLGRDTLNLCYKARQLGLNYQQNKINLARQRKERAEQLHKADTTKNERSEELEEIMRTRRTLDNGKVSVRFDSKTIILMPASKATPAHIARLRERMGKVWRA